MARNLVICLDGTGGEVKAKGNSNVVALYALLDRSDPDRQIAYYDPGVGTRESAHGWNPVTRTVSRLSGLIVGAGLRENLGEAYAWLMKNWQQGDRVFVFGFSRGAYSARSVSGILRAIGLLEQGTENLIPYAVAAYSAGSDGEIDENASEAAKARAKAKRDAYWAKVHKVAEVLSRRLAKPGTSDTVTTVPVAYLGLWDTVKSTGVLRWQTRWPYTRQLLNVARVRHAVSIDERRSTFRNYLVTPPKTGLLEEAWFAGIHSDVGGGFLDGTQLSRIAMKWVVDGAIAEGLLVRSQMYRARLAVTVEDSAGPVHRTGWYWGLLGWHRRTIPEGANVHASVRERRERVPDYQPPLPASASWVDEDWTTPAKIPARAKQAASPAPAEPPAQG